jgi:hypothetical protein
MKGVQLGRENSSRCTTELDYTDQSSWLLLLKYLDDLEQDKSAPALRLRIGEEQ